MTPLVCALAQHMVSGELAGECLQTGFERHGLPPQRAPLDTVYPLKDHLNSVQREGLFPDTVCWTRLRNTWYFSRAKELQTGTDIYIYIYIYIHVYVYVHIHI